MSRRRSVTAEVAQRQRLQSLVPIEIARSGEPLVQEREGLLLAVARSLAEKAFLGPIDQKERGSKTVGREARILERSHQLGAHPGRPVPQRLHQDGAGSREAFGGKTDLTVRARILPVHAMAQEPDHPPRVLPWHEVQRAPHGPRANDRPIGKCRLDRRGRCLSHPKTYAVQPGMKVLALHGSEPSHHVGRSLQVTLDQPLTAESPQDDRGRRHGFSILSQREAALR